jgi:glucose/arabinose dehydrogenase
MDTRLSWMWLYAALTFLCAGAATAQDIVTGFEFNDTSGEFVLGVSPRAATFTSGEAKSVGVLSLYHGGLSSWMIDAGGTGTVDFETPAAALVFFFRDQASDVDSVLTATDSAGQILATFAGTENAWTRVDLSGAAPVARITLLNNAAPGALGRYSVIDDLSASAFESVPLLDPIPEPIPQSAVEVSLEPVTSGLTAPNWGTHAGDGSNRLFVADQPGIVYAVDLSSGVKSTFLDASARLVPLGAFGPGTFDERGLLGLAFHPNYSQNGLLYTYTSEPADRVADFPLEPGTAADHQSVVSEWSVPVPANLASVVDPASRRELLRVDEPQFNHDGGALAFGPDGMLYISLGDGGNADDQGSGHSAGGNGQDPSNVLGTILRIDVAGTDSANGQYGIPPDNPFMGQAAHAEEIYAYGLRNPFRISFDSLTGTLYIADVGQNDIEEIDVGVSGANYGWRFKEGSFFFDDNGADAGFVIGEDPGVPQDLVDPIAEYDHDEGAAIIGGFVYRGGRVPELDGRYVFGDFNGRVFHLTGQDPIAELALPDFTSFVLGFGEDETGQLYVMANDSGVPFERTGVVLRVPEPAAVVLQGVAFLTFVALRYVRRRKRFTFETSKLSLISSAVAGPTNANSNPSAYPGDNSRSRFLTAPAPTYTA